MPCEGMMEQAANILLGSVTRESFVPELVYRFERVQNVCIGGGKSVEAI